MPASEFQNKQFADVSETQVNLFAKPSQNFNGLKSNKQVITRISDPLEMFFKTKTNQNFKLKKKSNASPINLKTLYPAEVGVLAKESLKKK